ncbi:NAD(P)-dependent oxidoreductase [Cohaesibacter intestini]|uniref:NAD(P)-dependent oxidoreductase n=1 Tax=Cohaesibacter intestini TaxID=2211145 RepID=UPI000DE904B3|nr:NAD(P)-dependent oxidoreductase [Cohaesibacter intestini]
MTLLLNEAGRRKRRTRRERVGCLATLPVFFNLKGAKVVVAGDGDGAAWKAELLAASGAEVHVHAPAPEEDMLDLLTNGKCHSGQLIWHRKQWDETSFDGAVMAIGDLETTHECVRFRLQANAAGAVVNIIDKPAYCQFQFGSIVNRSPVVIGISTDGAAPILGQAIRRRIESLLSSTMADWADLARRVRPAVLRHLTAGAPRRRFWERFVDLAFSGRKVPDVSHFDGFIAEVARLKGKPGTVTFIDASHGESDLLPMRAIRALQGADVILHGPATNLDILELARREAKRQTIDEAQSFADGEFVSTVDRMVALSQSGKHVVRLLATDPRDSQQMQCELQSLTDRHIPTAAIPPLAREEQFRHGFDAVAAE